MIHLIKLCVGMPNVEALKAWRAQNAAAGNGRADGNSMHRTRMTPRRKTEIVGQGSLYWVMSGSIRCRQRIVALEEGQDKEGRGFCDIIMDPEIIIVTPKRKRPFQGWRYLKPADTPRDVEGENGLPEGDMANELARLGLI